MIKAVDLSKTYFQGKARIDAVRCVSLEIKGGESVLIAGSSGAGKSTLLHLLGGLEKPTKGAVSTSCSEIGFVFQFYYLLPEFTVLENVMLPALIKGARLKDIKKKAGTLLDLVRLGHRVGHRPGEISGGESQRAAIARALINSPEVLLCDEPTGNLDSKIGSEVMSCLKSLRDKENMALVVVTHDEHMREDFNFDRKLYMKDGMIEEEKKAEHGSKSLFEWKAC